jgi:multidrug efflux pump
VGGLLLSQLLTLYTTPVIYLYMERFRVAMGRAMTRTRATLGLRPATQGSSRS